MRRAAKVDANHGEVVKALRACRFEVLDLSPMGKGCPDLLVCAPVFPWRLFLIEVKDGAKPPSARKLTDDQQKFHARWPGTIHVVHSPEQALQAVGVIP